MECSGVVFGKLYRHSFEWLRKNPVTSAKVPDSPST